MEFNNHDIIREKYVGGLSRLSKCPLTLENRRLLNTLIDSIVNLNLILSVFGLRFNCESH